MAAVVLEDFYKPFFPKQLSEKQTYLLMKFTVVIMGAICIGMVFVVEKLGAVLQVSSKYHSSLNYVQFIKFIKLIFVLVNNEHWCYSKWSFSGTLDNGDTSSMGKCKCKLEISRIFL